jgi:hypothetical protein
MSQRERSRDGDGEWRRKRSDTNVGTIEQQYGVDFGVRNDMQLETLRRQTGLSSIQELLRHARHQGSN